MEIRRRERHVTQRRDAEEVTILLAAGHGRTPDILTALHVRECRVPVAAEHDTVVTADAARTLEQRESLPLLRRQRIRVALEVTVERCTRRDQCALERGDRARHVIERQRILLTWERCREERLVSGLTQSLHRLLRRQVHLDVSLDRTLGLLLECRCAPVPELRGEEGGVEDRGTVPRAGPRTFADRDLARIHACRTDHMAGVARDDPRPRQLRLEEELVSELDPFRRRRVVLRLRRLLGKRLEQWRNALGPAPVRGRDLVAVLAGARGECEKQRNQEDRACCGTEDAPSLYRHESLHEVFTVSDKGSLVDGDR